MIEKFFIADIEYLLQPDQIIYKDIPPPHLYKRVGTAAHSKNVSCQVSHPVLPAESNYTTAYIYKQAIKGILVK